MNRCYFKIKSKKFGNVETRNRMFAGSLIRMDEDATVTVKPLAIGESYSHRLREAENAYITKHGKRAE